MAGYRRGRARPARAARGGGVGRLGVGLAGRRAPRLTPAASAKPLSGTISGTTSEDSWPSRRAKHAATFSGLIERVNLDHTEVEITSKRGSAVLMSKDEYDSLVETSYLLRSPENARRLLSALASARDNAIEEHDLVEP
ncbi:type II toxin-antitoxin system Phd/YefM family antitoxin [Microbacterium testaceum]|uniref:type II toxin-antitoxin system Phd/YefM family antitoxin n=1 Tax=Microbacterium testaceum TaxID=2033 RepID=UPI0027D8A008|nr:type II toxin-antitoxin system prevent-host-death family antitoxin [Microbacterium testaceum]